MPIYTDAVWKPISGGSGPHVGGPGKIVHHTTEGSKAKDAFDAFRINRSDPHFTVDETAIYQHIDTDIGARALKNLGGGVQTNRDSAIQIEVVGFAHRPKSKATLRNVAKLCRWIEKTHGVANSWPNGYPKVATPAGKDPGGHNRDAVTWDKTSGHYGHSQVPENSHWDPAYTKAEVDFIRTWGGEEGVFSTAFDEIPETDPGLASDTSQMPDHADVGEAPAAGGDRQEAVDGVISRWGQRSLDSVDRAIRSGQIDPKGFGFASPFEGAPVDVEAMLHSNPVSLEAIIQIVGRPSFLVRDGQVLYEAIELLPGFTTAALAQGVARVPSVGRVEFVNHESRSWGGTGFVVDVRGEGRRIVATNRHVAAIVARRAADGAGVFLRSDRGLRYGARLDMREEVGSAPGNEFELPVTAVIYLADDTEADLALLEIAVHDGLAPEPIPLASGAARVGDLVAVIGYPARDSRNSASSMANYFGDIFGVKRLAPGLITRARAEEGLSYDCTTLGGNSGSAVIGLADGTVQGVHFWGEEGKENRAVGVNTLKRILAGGRTQVALPPGSGTESRADGGHSAADLTGRNGYAADFLGDGMLVPWPEVPDGLKGGLARPSDRRSDDDFELRYRNFGILYHAGRRVPLLTAVNIDGAHTVRIKRGDDQWFTDGRIDAAIQLDAAAYGDADIDRGHMVRREDPNWGDHAEQANFDTFHYTNAAPQHRDLNQSGTMWAGLETYILNSARTYGFRACVFAGPILRDDDPQLLPSNVGLPREFWKIVAMPATGGGMLATGYVLSQGHMIGELKSLRRNDEAAEGFQIGGYRTFQVAIRDIEAVTGLSFPALRDHDPLVAAAGSQESATVTYRVVDRPGDIILGGPPAPASDAVATLAARLARLEPPTILSRITALQDDLPPDTEAPAEIRDLFAAYRAALDEQRSGAEAPAPDYATLAKEYTRLLATCSVRPSHAGEVKWIVKKLNQYRSRYEKVGKSMDIPWWFVGITHALEASFDFGSHLHNGDPLGKRTVQVPKGRPKVWNPPNDWESSAVDAMTYQGYAGQADWSATRALYRFEGYNGWGYRPKGINSPYLWSFSNHYTKGKYVADGKYDANAVSKQCGAGVLMKQLGVA